MQIRKEKVVYEIYIQRPASYERKETTYARICAQCRISVK